MKRALDEARTAWSRGDVPVGALVVSAGPMGASLASPAGPQGALQAGGEVIGWGSNVKTIDPTAHAEMQALRMAASRLGSWNLAGCTLYVTLEPCPMCAGACIAARISRVVFGAYDPRAGAAGSLWDILSDSRLNHRCSVRGGVLKEDCARLLQDYFLERRGRRTQG